MFTKNNIQHIINYYFMIFLMEIDNYPENNTILHILEIMEEIKAAKDYDALVVAETELQFVLLDKEQWIKYQGLKNN